MNDVVSFLCAIQGGNYDAVGVLADWLDEHGDPRGRLVRRRWRQWQKKYASACAADRLWEKRRRLQFTRLLDSVRAMSGSPIECETLVIRTNVNEADVLNELMLYLRKKFPQESY